MDLGRRLSAVDFTVFLTIFHDVQVVHLAPLNRVAQNMGEEGPETERRAASTVARLSKSVAALTGIREWLGRSVLLAGYVLPQ